MISYYELLDIIKEGNAPKKISVSLTYGTTETYEATYDGGKFSYYWLTSNISNENYKNYLTECFLESMMFDKCITILDEEDKFVNIKNVARWDTGFIADFNICGALNVLTDEINLLINNQKKIIEKLKENNN